MECAEVRDLLPEHALGTLNPATAAEVEAHLTWCAACGTEAVELAEGAAALAAALPDADPPPDLEERVVAMVAAAAGRPAGRRRGVAAAVVAAFLAVAASGWGVAMAGRAERLEGAAATAREEATLAAEEFAGLLRLLADDGDEGPVREAPLGALPGAEGGGQAILYEAGVEGSSDFVLVLVGGLPEDAGPYRARLVGADGALRVGRLWPSAGGRLAAYRLFRAETAGFEGLEVVDRTGRVVLRGVFRP